VRLPIRYDSVLDDDSVKNTLLLINYSVVIIIMYNDIVITRST